MDFVLLSGYCWVPLDHKKNGKEPNAHCTHTQKLLYAAKRKKQGGGLGTESHSPCDFTDIIPLALYTAFALPSILKTSIGTRGKPRGWAVLIPPSK